MKLVRFGEAPNEIVSLEGDIELSIWKDFQNRSGVYAARSAQEVSTGLFKLDVGGDMVVESPSIGPEHLAAYEHLLSQQEQVQSSILARLLNWYSELRPKVFREVEAIGWSMPEVYQTGDFRKLIGLSSIHLMNAQRDGLAYVGYEFGCSWDEEHGLGLMLHGNRVVDLGHADSSFLTWVAEEDGGTVITFD
ncbi:MAG: hypothetical protein KA175_18115 [Flavobacteriales bacterium]|nr:hypothetical protein [Flavobacteriales bacterium]MBP7409210.1 hypothetical protein [Flavobacteriales bacterium]